MRKEQFLAFSLPYELKVTLNQKGKFNLDEDYPQPHNEVCSVVDMIIGKPFKYEIADGNIGYGYIEEDEFDIILHPLTDLTKEIEHKGEKFVPIEKLKEIIGGGWCNVYERAVECMQEWNIDTLKNKIKYLPFEFVQFFVSWHFDIFGGIDNGEAIDVNTLDKNPYA